MSEEIVNEPKTIKAKTLWEGGLRSNTLIRGFEVAADDPLKEWGTNTAPSPSETFLATLSACLTSTYAWAALTSRVHHSAITTSISADIADADGTRKITNIQMTLKANAIEGTPEKLQKIFELAHKNCLLVNSIGIPTKVSFEYKIAEE
jgi:uncharacterized OsmC-like protein